MPPARRIDIDWDTLVVRSDPSDPDSLRHRIVDAYAVMVVDFGPGRISVTSASHEFRVVRGDVAVLTDEQRADSLRWYILEWTELPEGLPSQEIGPLADNVQVEPSDSTARPVAMVPAVFAFIALDPNPAHRSIAVSLSLPRRAPAWLEVFDVSGRRVERHDLGDREPGRHEVQVNSGGRLATGKYWIRLSQDGRIATRTAVVIR